MRRTIAERMQHSYQTAPHITLTAQVDMSAALALRQEINTRATATGEPNVSVTALLVKVCAWALLRHPWLNASLLDDGIHLHAAANVGVAVALEGENGGLIVPVVHGAEALGLVEIARRLQAVTERARQNRLRPEDVTGGTFTLSNLGTFGGIDQFTAILNPPECAILAVGRIAKQQVVIEQAGRDEVVIRPMMHLTLSADHRVVDGAVAARFVRDLREALQHPSLLLA
jgi:pyruvate dehydrogenase E2 component (dihydrolipoamide acetyltransferase)